MSDEHQTHYAATIGSCIDANTTYVHIPNNDSILAIVCDGEQITISWKELFKLLDEIFNLRKPKDLERENAKLHELVRAAWRCIHTGASCSDCRLIAGGCTLQTAMREMGIEVDG